MPYATEHNAKLLEPSGFDSFKRVEVERGVSVIIGIKDEKETWQAIRFNKFVYKPEDALAWLKANDYEPMLFEEAARADKKDSTQKVKRNIKVEIG